MTYEEELEVQININRMKESLARLALNLGAERIKMIAERTIEERIASWESKLENLQKHSYPLILQKACLENVIKYKMEKIYKDHC